MKTVYNAAPDRFVMILDESNPEYMNLQDRSIGRRTLGCKYLLLGIQSIYYSKNFGCKIIA
jgi:hypothetical protein